MKLLWKTTIGFGALGVLILMSGYFVDHHRCKQVNYEQAGYELPETWLISARQCLDTANAIRLRSYARNI